MKEKINLAELLKDCPSGMELDCTMYEDCKFLDVDVDHGTSYSIRITTPCGIRYLDKYGRYTNDDKAKCVIFPKNKTTWEGFHRPFKVGDRVKMRNSYIIGIITNISDGFYKIEYQEGSVSYVNIEYQDNWELVELKLSKEEDKAPKLTGQDYSGKRFGYKLPDGYEFDCIENNEVILKPKKPRYPKTYEECCDILGIDVSRDIEHTEHLPFYRDINQYDVDLLRCLIQFRKLLICRDAYWKIVGEQMGLDKPWEPRDTKDRYIIRRAGDTIVKSYKISCVLEFPTPEIRDIFYDNFKELIESCKELL